MGAFRVGTRPGEFVFSFLTQSSPERVVGVCPDLGIAGGLFDFGTDELVLNRIGNIGFHHWAAGGRSDCPVHRRCIRCR